MNSFQVSSSQKIQQVNSAPILRNGQIIQGKVLKLFPNQRAEIQIGNQTIIAKLDASLALHSSYHFQVQIKDSVIYLKVITEQLRKAGNTDLANLLRYLGFKPTKANISLLQFLKEHQVPVDRHQLAQAFSLFETIQQRENAKQVLLFMMNNRLPISEMVFNALMTRKTNGHTDMLQSFIQSLRKDDVNHPIYERLIDLAETPLSEKSKMIKELILSRNLMSLHLLQAAQKIPLSVTMDRWNAAWEPFLAIVKQGSNRQINQYIEKTPLPFQITEQDIIHLSEKLVSNQESIRTKALEILEQWGSKLNIAIREDKGLAFKELSQLSNQAEKLFSLLTNSGQQPPWKLSNTPFHLRQLLAILNTLNDPAIYEQTSQSLSFIEENNIILSQSPKEQFLHQLRQILSILSYEQQIGRNEGVVQSSMKGMLIQFMNESFGQAKEQGMKLLEFIHGMQLQTVQESNSFIQMQLQVPMERLGLHKDMTIEIESRKTKDGKINPDYCRILFFLDLQFIGQTIIDVMVQKRSISMIVYNDTEQIESFGLSMKPLLKERLEKLEYQLSHIIFKTLDKRKIERKNKMIPFEEKSVHGVDYRI